MREQKRKNMFSLLLLVYLQSSPIHPLSSSLYTSYTLEQTCGQDGSKQSLHLNSQAAVFTFNSTNRKKLDCHLEIHLHSKALGFSVFIETLKIDRSSGCSRDFLQFGRDKFVITTHLSKKYCDTIEHSANITDENGALVGYDFKDTSFLRREYIETNDVEMDIWLELQPAQNNQIKEVKLVVTPFRKSCNEEDEEYYKLCPGTRRCFKKHFFCAGIVKCAVLTADEINRFCVKEAGGFLYFPVIIILIVVLIITTTLIGFGIKIFLSHLNDDDIQSLQTVPLRNSINPRTRNSGSVQSVTSLLTPERDQRRPTSQEVPLDLHPPDLPSHPPSYDEVVGIGYKDDPPKYSEIAQVLEQ
eukprot:GFUD01095883.1.p1 GENE.GFUD01095883.1~~GFUD01095883.1.p1  ORF type:complete len:357 (-),score=98.16 GFUD01095883.1:116-1186(-)